MSRIGNLLQKVNWLEQNQNPQRTDSQCELPPKTAVSLSDMATARVTLAPETRLVYHTDPHSAAADRYRMLRIRTQTLWSAGKLPKLLVTSPLPGDGKSTVVLNLATALAEKGKRTVLVVEADLHHFPLAHCLGLRPQSGLTECLESGADPLTFIRHLDPLDWYLLPAGRASKNPTELLQGPILQKLLEGVATHFDCVLIDSPPVLALSDALILKQHTDASLLVVKASRTGQDAVEEAVTLLGKQHILGIVLNGVENPDLVYHKYDGYSSYTVRSSTRKPTSDLPE
jgi:capsular exopolysaccharide synthesis family protein